MATYAKQQALQFSDIKTYLFALLFIIGNILLPQLCHQFSLGGPTWLPIYLFTLIGAYKYGWRVGLLTALASPAINSLLFAMPIPAMLPIITIKSSLLAIFVALAAKAADRKTAVALTALVAAILGYQLLGTIAEYALTGSSVLALQDLTIGLPGIAVQLFTALLLTLNRK